MSIILAKPSGGSGGSGGSGDMTKAVYDTDDSGVVDSAEVITNQGALATLNTVDTAQINDEAVTEGKISSLFTGNIAKKAGDNMFVGGNTFTQDITIPDDNLTIAKTSGLQTALDGKSATVHTHTASQITDFDTEVSNNAAVSANTVKISYTDAAKVAGIEAGADVTDTLNVTAAGALMDSEIANLAQVKAFDSSDYATSAQGTKADSALQSESDTLATVTARGATTEDAVTINNDLIVGTDTFYVDSDNNKVGIGTTNPNNPLEVSDSADGANINLLKLSNTGGQTTGTEASIYFAPTNSTTGRGAKISGYQEKENQIGLKFNVGLASDAATEAMYIDPSGNVGIGTTDPDTKLHIAGAITQEPLSSAPSDPDVGNSVQWVSDGTGSGNAGDIMMKINVGGTVKVVTLVDFNSLS